MTRDQIDELHYITPIENVTSILRNGILSYQHSNRLRHYSIASQVIQDRRDQKVVPGGRPLHDYVNLYFCAKNPMMYLRRGQHQTLCILRVSTNVLDLPGVVITDQNAASNYARFWASPGGLEHIDHDLVFADYWTHPEDQIEEWKHKSAKCAEVLVPDVVGSCFVMGAYVSCVNSLASFREHSSSLPVTTNGGMFFLQEVV